MADVFISYSMKTAADIARDVADALRSNDISCWYAGEHKELGVYAENIVTSLESCRIFLLLMDKAALQSHHVKTETAIAFHRLREHEKITLVPFRVEKCSPREDKAMYYYLLLQEIVEGCPPDAEHIQDLVARITRVLNA